ncbi:MAG: M81 family metallopeptidase [Gammaproteobacteria bacterium]|nr:M81 family metallopeptidase [Gammaproteobacteria bacterium]
MALNWVLPQVLRRVVRWKTTPMSSWSLRSWISPPRVDALMLDLHGAMVTKTFDDGEGELLRRLRARYPQMPITIALDMHATVTADMAANADIICGYHTHPHIDMAETAERAGNLLLDMIEGRCQPVMSWGNAPMLPHVMRQGTDDDPNRSLQARVMDMERSEALAASVFVGFPHADIHDAGLSAVVITNAAPDMAMQLRNELLRQAWNDRQQFVYRPEPLEFSMNRARELAQQPGQGPVLLLDHYDNTASGGTVDSTNVLAAVLGAGLEDVAIFGIFDPDAVQAMVDAGIGAQITLTLGGACQTPSIPRQSPPITVTGRVKLLADGRFPATVAMSRGMTMDMGRCSVLSIGSVDLVVISRHIEPFDPGCFRAVDIEPTARRYLMIKSRIHYRVGFRALVKATVECAGVGVCTSDYSELKFSQVRRPVYPLDGVNTPPEQWLKGSLI